MDIALAVQLLSLLPPITFGTPAAPAQAEGTATLLILACAPDTAVTVLPGAFHATTGADGTARLEVPAQLHDAEPYQILTESSHTRLIASLEKGQTLAGFCQ